jgi:hypothetical protein
MVVSKAFTNVVERFLGKTLGRIKTEPVLSALELRMARA